MWSALIHWIRVASDNQLEVPAKERNATSAYPNSDREIRQDPGLTRSALATPF